LFLSLGRHFRFLSEIVYAISTALRK